MRSILLDTSVWIEHFKKTEKSEKITSSLKENLVYTCPLTLAEIANWCYKNNQQPEVFLKSIKVLSSVIELNEEILVLAAKVCYNKRKKNSKIGLIDCIIYSTASNHNLVLVTTDNDFRDLPNVEFL